MVPEDEQAKALLRLLQPPQRLRALRAAMFSAPDVAPARGGQLQERRPSGSRKLARLLLEMLSEGKEAARRQAEGGEQAEQLLQPQQDWHPGLEDEPWDADSHRLHRLLCAYGAAGARDPSRQQGVILRLLKAYRQGHLGRHTWDELEELGEPAGAGGGAGGTRGAQGLSLLGGPGRLPRSGLLQ